MAISNANGNPNGVYGNNAISQPVSEFHSLVRNFGTTAQRPTVDLITNQTYFDVTLGYWIYWTGSAWAAVSGGGSGVTTSTPPLYVSGSNISLTATVSNDGGTIVKSPTSAQSGSINVTGNITGATISGSYMTSSGTVQATNGFSLSGILIIDSGPIFPTTPSDGQRYRHTTYRSWFTYNSADAKWRQEAPGPFNGSFPTVSSGDNTAAPQIEVKRIDRDNRVYFWNGTYWLTSATFPIVLGWLPAMASNSISATTQVIANVSRPHASYDIWVEACQQRLNNTGTADSSNYWTLELSAQDDSNVITSLGTVTHQTTGVATKSVTINSATRVRTLTQSNQFFTGLTKTGAPGNVTVTPPVLVYRLVG